MNDIEQGNVVIAKFLGWTPKERFHYLRNKTVIEWENCPYEYIEVGTEQFHTSWDWLMPVVEKIETISTDEIKSISFSLESINLQGKPMRFKWLDAYMGIFRFEGDKSFITVNQWKDVTDDLFQFMIAKDQTFQD